MFSIEFDDNWSFGKNPNEYFAFSLKRYHVKQWINGAESVYHVLHLIWLDTQVSSNAQCSPVRNTVICNCFDLAWFDTIRFDLVHYNVYTRINFCTERRRLCENNFVFCHRCLQYFHWKSMIFVVVTELLMHCVIQCLNKMQCVCLNLVVVAIIRIVLSL